MYFPAPKQLLDGLLREWLPRQRWFPVKSGGFAMDETTSFPLPAPGSDAAFEITLLSVAYTGAGGARQSDVIQLPLSFHPEAVPELEKALLGSVQDDDGGTRWVYDAAYDPEFIESWLALIPFLLLQRRNIA